MSASNDLKCELYLKSKEYKSGETKSEDFKFCCVENTYCAFYYQSWFLILSISFAMFFLLIFLLCAYKCYRRRYGKNGIDEDASEGTTPELIVSP
ncbi:hypothetical protein CAEBREN_21435 [Caenorhabditis brenneri]|uniref:Uncharacterized protein n=1 Tax=Caenorhabditis brenneri TaxID=135651 RepID=G0MDL3_CAEBE|nr:hypothetical protein CAEBREN_21435 [Caenorhabditis brenneri]